MDAKITLLAAGLLVFTGAAQATDLNYDYIEVGYSQVDFDDIDEDLTGVTIGGSFLLSEEIFVYGSYSDGETDRFSGGRFDVSGYSLGLGYRFGISPQTDVNFGAAFEHAEVEGKGTFSGFGSDSENGYSLLVGVRHLVSRDFEIGANVTYVDIDTDDTVLTLGGLWHVTELVAVGLGYFVGSDASGFEGGVRFKF